MKFTLRDLFWLVLVATVVLCTSHSVASDQDKEAIAAAISETGGVTDDMHGVYQVDLFRDLDTCLSRLASLDASARSKITFLGFHADVAKPDNWDKLARFPNVRHLYLARDARWSREVAQQLPGLTKLESLHVPSSKIDSDGLKSIGKCKNLKHLWLQDSDLSECDLTPLANLTELLQAMLSNTNIKSSQLQFVEELPKLGWLVLSRNERIDSSAVRSLSRCQSLEILNLLDTNMDDASISRLEKALPRGCLILSGKSEETPE